MPLDKAAAQERIAAKLKELGFPVGKEEYPTWKLAEVIAEIIPYITENGQAVVDGKTGVIK